ncbi:unnamed protein product [Absidia cylindrospora]
MDALVRFKTLNGVAGTPLEQAADACFQKLKKYYTITDDSQIHKIAFSLDPGLSNSYIHRHEWETDYVNQSRCQLRIHFDLYQRRYGNSDIAVAPIETNIQGHLKNAIQTCMGNPFILDLGF